MKKNEEFPLSSDFRSFRCFMSFDSATLPSGAIPKPRESENVRSPPFWDLQIFAGFLRVISNVFSGSFHFAQLNPQTLKTPWTSNCLSKNKDFLEFQVFDVKVHRFQRKAGKHRERRGFSRILNLQEELIYGY